MPTRTPIAAPVARRLFDRLIYWQFNGPFFAYVREIVLGWPRLSIPNTYLTNPVTLWVSALPLSAAGGVGAGSMASTTEYTGLAQIACVGADTNDLDGFYHIVETLDDVVQIVCEVEQGTRWGETAGTYGETANTLFNANMDLEYPNLEVKDGDNRVVAMHHMAIARWQWKSFVTWA